MATLTTPLVSVEEYLGTVYRPDADYLDGELRQRSMADTDHARMQVLLVVALHPLERRYGVRTLTETRIEVSSQRFRIADLCVVRDTAKPPKILVDPPLLCVEILSPTDRLEDIQERVDDYLAMGVPQVWVLSPRTRRGWVHTADGVREAKDGILRTSDPDLAVPIASLFDEP
jgi:Uma2 family endonuclease